MKKMKLPLFPEEVIRVGRNKFITIKQLRDYVFKNHPDLAERYCIHKTFNPSTGAVEKKYAWHSIIDEMNSDGTSEEFIKTMLWTSNTEDPN